MNRGFRSWGLIVPGCKNYFFRMSFGVFVDCFSIIDRRQEDQSVAAFLEATGDDLAEDVGGKFVGLAVPVLEAAQEAEEGLAGGRTGSKKHAELGELAGVTAVLEGVEVAFWGTSAGATTAPPGLFGHKLALIFADGLCGRQGRTSVGKDNLWLTE